MKDKQRLIADIIVTHDFMVHAAVKYTFKEPKTLRRDGAMTILRLTPSTHNPNIILKIPLVLHSDDHVYVSKLNNLAKAGNRIVAEFEPRKNFTEEY